jgi:hypothetical protein
MHRREAQVGVGWLPCGRRGCAKLIKAMHSLPPEGSGNNLALAHIKEPCRILTPRCRKNALIERKSALHL